MSRLHLHHLVLALAPVVVVVVAAAAVAVAVLLPDKSIHHSDSNSKQEHCALVLSRASCAEIVPR